MVCPFCNSPTQVINSRSRADGQKIWRRRRCTKCGETLTTYERIDLSFLVVSKRQGETETYSYDKLYSSLYRAHLDPAASRELTNTVESKILRLRQPLISSREIAELSAQTLLAFDKPTHARYMSFQDSKN